MLSRHKTCQYFNEFAYRKRETQSEDLFPRVNNRDQKAPIFLLIRSNRDTTVNNRPWPIFATSII